MADLEFSVPELRLYVVVCATPGCMNQGHEITVSAPVDDPIVQCGPCGVQLDPTPVP